MIARLALLTVVPLLAIEPVLATNAGAREPFPDQQLMDQLHDAQAYALKAGQDLAQSIAIIEQAIPRYGMPYLDTQGNIVIPRLAPAQPHGTPVPDLGPGPPL
jgi:hypothetical protein